MGAVTPFRRPQPELVDFEDRAAENLRFIRDTMERATAFTAVSGWGLIVAGAIALLGAVFASLAPTHLTWLAAWLSTAVLACISASSGVAAKARNAGVSLVSGPARKCIFGFC